VRLLVSAIRAGGCPAPRFPLPSKSRTWPLAQSTALPRPPVRCHISNYSRIVDPSAKPPYPCTYTCKKMRPSRPPIRLFALLFALVLLAGQVHLCADFGSPNSGSHVCQVCATAGHAVIAQSLLADITPSVCRMESLCSQGEVQTLAYSVTSPRAPPTV
jgi:hypothetical protein